MTTVLYSFRPLEYCKTEKLNFLGNIFHLLSRKKNVWIQYFTHFVNLFIHFIDQFITNLTVYNPDG